MDSEANVSPELGGRRFGDYYKRRHLTNATTYSHHLAGTTKVSNVQSRLLALLSYRGSQLFNFTFRHFWSPHSGRNFLPDGGVGAERPHSGTRTTWVDGPLKAARDTTG